MDRQRIDKWLWHMRLVRTRKLAAALADGGQVRVNGARISAASRAVKIGDIVTVALDHVRVLKVQGFAERRGSADDAATLFEDLQPVVAAPRSESVVAAAFSREPGSGRPTKRDRRALERLKS